MFNLIYRVFDKERANYCDNLLTKLIQDERQYDKSIDKDFVVKNFYNNVIQDDRNILLVYEEEKIIKGFIYLKPHLEQKDAYIVDALFVEEQYRNKGIAKSLFEEAKILLKKWNIDKLYIDVISNNNRAFNLYKSIGSEVFRLGLKMEI